LQQGAVSPVEHLVPDFDKAQDALAAVIAGASCGQTVVYIDLEDHKSSHMGLHPGLAVHVLR
jgi:hypothetical protein